MVYFSLQRVPEFSMALRKRLVLSGALLQSRGRGTEAGDIAAKPCGRFGQGYARQVSDQPSNHCTCLGGPTASARTAQCGFLEEVSAADGFYYFI